MDSVANKLASPHLSDIDHEILTLKARHDAEIETLLVKRLKTQIERRWKSLPSWCRRMDDRNALKAMLACAEQGYRDADVMKLASENLVKRTGGRFGDGAYSSNDFTFALNVLSETSKQYHASVHEAAGLLTGLDDSHAAPPQPRTIAFEPASTLSASPAPTSPSSVSTTTSTSGSANVHDHTSDQTHLQYIRLAAEDTEPPALEKTQASPIPRTTIAAPQQAPTATMFNQRSTVAVVIPRRIPPSEPALAPTSTATGSANATLVSRMDVHPNMESSLIGTDKLATVAPTAHQLSKLTSTKRKFAGDDSAFMDERRQSAHAAKSRIPKSLQDGSFGRAASSPSSASLTASGSVATDLSEQNVLPTWYNSLRGLQNGRSIDRGARDHLLRAATAIQNCNRSTLLRFQRNQSQPSETVDEQDLEEVRITLYPFWPMQAIMRR